MAIRIPMDAKSQRNVFLDIFKEDKELNGLNIEQALRNLNKGGGQ